MQLDHLVLAVPDLAAGVEYVADLTGVPAAPGGRHVGLGTANALLGLGRAAYLEIVGPDPEGEPPAGPRPFGVDGLDAPRLVTWAVRSLDIAADVAAARAAGHDPGPARGMSRRTPDGRLLRWTLTLAEDGRDTGAVPFVIDWLDTAHPTEGSLPHVTLTGFDIGDPHATSVRAALDALGCDVAVHNAPRTVLRAELETPRGAVQLS